MILLADSGSTKTDWRMIADDGTITQAKSAGFNPNYQKITVLKALIEETSLSHLSENVNEVYYYGSGCSLPENIKKVQDTFLAFFPDALIHINHDLLAAARSLCGREQGIACILGTGANSCFYDGQSIKTNVPSLGYLIGDEGAGSWLGKQLLTDFLREDMPIEIRKKLIDRFSLTRDNIISSVYQQEGVIQYFSGFSKFIFQNLKSAYLYKLVYRGFETFIDKNVLKYENCFEVPVHFTGSIAFYYSNILRQVASDKGIIVKNIIESPIAGLTLFHQTK